MGGKKDNLLYKICLAPFIKIINPSFSHPKHPEAEVLEDGEGLVGGVEIMVNINQ